MLVYAIWIVLIRLDIVPAETLRIYPYALLAWAAIVALIAAFRRAKSKQENAS